MDSFNIERKTHAHKRPPSKILIVVLKFLFFYVSLSLSKTARADKPTDSPRKKKR